MAVSININGLTLCHKGSDGVTRNTLPDVCKTPDKGLPLPYRNEAYSRDLVKGTTSVFADGHMSIAKYGSQFHKSIYDEAGSMGGVASGTNKAEADWITHSFDVFFEGKPACRLTDKMFMNHRNTVNMAGLKQRDLPQSDQDFYDELCRMACECLAQKGSMTQGQTFQDCVRKKIDEAHYNGRYPKPDAKMWREVPYDRGSGWDMIGSKNNPGLPTSNFIRPDSRRLDVVRLGADGKPSKIIDMKFGDDSLSVEAEKDYKRIARKHTGSSDGFEEFRVEEKCDCDDGGNPPGQPVPVTAPAEQKEGFLDKFGKALEQSTGIKLAGGALVAFFVVSEVSRLFPARNLVPVP
ncbi:DUF4150 domain-containing protein [Roseateles sp.]|uniref:DUF4150 domain-containing protein n=1 Tax=Roseateles sp. TaxID=1971397 RepID=UPI0031D7871A